jgi:16S rRNA (uracil1498-N3)-methyltransferase
MTYFLAPGDLAEGATAVLEGDEARHLLQSRRIKAGERFALQDPAGRRFWAEVIESDRRTARVRILAPAPVPPPPPVAVRLWVAAVKDKAAEWIVQKATELAVAEVHVFSAAYSPLSPDELAAPRTAQRWQRIAVEACKQCDRQYPPAIAAWPSLGALLAARPERGAAWLLDAGGGAPLRPALAQAVTILAGPEGGLEQAERRAALDAGFAPVSLGPLTLRTETAALAGCAVALQAGTLASGAAALEPEALPPGAPR